MEVYLDNAATTKVSKPVYEAMKPYFKSSFGNPSSLHNKGIPMRKTINTSKKKIASLLHCAPTELYFTSCGTEATNWALKGLALSPSIKGEIITTRIEHHATTHTVEFLEKLGYIIHYVDVDNDGFIDLFQLEELINNNTLVVSIIYANNEIGTVQNIEKISEICRAHSTYLHVDAVQAITHIPLNLTELQVDLMSISGHKFHAPKGIGLLYIKEGTHIENLIHGGQQENERRAGTENVPYIVGITKAFEEGMKVVEDYNDRLNQFANEILDALKNEEIDFLLNGPKIGENRLPGNLNISFEEIDGSDIIFYLNKAGIYVSSGSACNSEMIEPSHVLKEINVPKDYINGSIRVSIGQFTTHIEITYFIKTLINIIKKLK
ncbi:MAG: cysteine desulfurase [Candidatus Izimaplasma sp.]|nr:cysteine desulfurase [Candidatus Izimaplasma bacterium]